MRPGSFPSSGMVPGPGGVAATGPGPGGQSVVGMDPNTGEYSFIYLFTFSIY